MLGFFCLFIFHFSDPHQKDDINKKAFDKFKKEHGVAPQADSAAPSERFEGKGVAVHRALPRDVKPGSCLECPGGGDTKTSSPIAGLLN